METKPDLFTVLQIIDCFMEDSVCNLNQLKMAYDQCTYQHTINSTRQQAILKACTSQIFNTLEGLGNLVSALVVGLANDEITCDRPPLFPLREVEIYTLKETSLKVQNCKVKEVPNSYMRTLEKLKYAPTLLNKLYSQQEYKLDISTKFWQYIVDLEKLRNDLMHQKFTISDINFSLKGLGFGELLIEKSTKFPYEFSNFFTPQNKITMVNGAKGLKWYEDELVALFKRHFPETNNLINSRLSFWQFEAESQPPLV